jgi:Fe-S cluster biogenesis protein NfuA
MTMIEEKQVKSTFEKVEEALQSIRPYLKADGGDVKVLEVDEQGNVKLELLGNCGDCPMSTMTFKSGVEETIKRAVPEVATVEAVNITPTGDNAGTTDRYV